MKHINLIIVLLLLIINVSSAKAQTNCPWSYRVSVSPLITNLTSNHYKNEETAGFGFNAGGDVIYNFYKIEKLSVNASLGLGITNYNNSRFTNYTNELWTSEYEQVLNANQDYYLTETVKNMNENNHMTFLDIPVKLGFVYDITSKWAAYANLGVAYGINLAANYTNSASLTRTGYYKDYNALIYDVDLSGSPFYYPTDKPVTGSGSISRKNNFSTEGALGAIYKLNSQLSFFAGAKLMHGFSNVKNNPATMIFATSDNSLNTLINRTDKIQTRAFGLEIGAQFSLYKFCKHKKNVVEPKIQNAFLIGKIQPSTTTLVIKDNGEVVKTIIPDANGMYKLDLLKGKVYDVEATAPGFVSQKTTIDLIEEDNSIQNDFSITLVKQNITVTGKVSDAENSVPLKSILTVKSNGEVVKIVEIDPNGLFEIELPKAKVYDIEIAALGYITQKQTIDLTSNENDIQNNFSLVSDIQGVLLIAKVLDAKTAAPVEAAMIIKNNDKMIKTVKADKAGTIKLDIPEGKSYEIEVVAPGYVPQRQIINLNNVARGVKKEINLDKIIKIEKGLVFKYNNVNFNTGTADLTPEALINLNMVSHILIENPKIKIEISGHTDNVGNPNANLNLSNRRANAVMKYLISKGAKPEQIKAIGYGQTKSIADNNTLEGRAENRRVEFMVIEI